MRSYIFPLFLVTALFLGCGDTTTPTDDAGTSQPDGGVRPVPPPPPTDGGTGGPDDGGVDDGGTDDGGIGDGGTDGGPLDACASQTRAGELGGACRGVEQACNNEDLQCQPAIPVSMGGPNDPIVDHPDGEDSVVDFAFFAGGMCTVVLFIEPEVEECSPEDEAACQEQCGVCTPFFSNAHVCLRQCEPNGTDNSVCRDGYECGLFDGVCDLGCVSNADCRISRPDTDNNGVIEPWDPETQTGDHLVYDTNSQAFCNTETYRCEHPGAPGAVAGIACEQDEQCEANGRCIDEETFGYPGGYCSKFGCDIEGNECAGTTSTCQERGFGIPLCAEACKVGSDIDASASSGGCRDGYTCWWNGVDDETAATNGACIPGTFTDVTENNVGSPCFSDAECYSPLGLGYCDPDFGCSILECDAPGLPAEFCGESNACVQIFSDTAACIAGCTSASECSFGDACVDADDDPLTPGGFCFPNCFADAECREGQTCDLELNVCTGGAGIADVGGECVADEACEGGLCLTEDVGFPGGYCSFVGCAVDSDCGATGRCVPTPSGNLCLTACGSAADCRDTYPCVDWDLDPATSDLVCFPGCVEDSECGEGQTCNTTLGLCGGGSGSGISDAGSECVADEGCEGNLCLTEDLGWVGGYCTFEGCISNADCGENGRCIPFAGTTVCAASCDLPTDCRDTYPCVDWDLIPETDDVVCFPFCEADAECRDGEVCGGTGFCRPIGPTCVDDGVTREIVSPAPGELTISEWLANPTGTEVDREWLELRAARTVDLNGVVLSDAANHSSTLESDNCLTVSAGSYALLVRNNNPAQNGGLPAETAMFAFPLNNDAETLRVAAGGVVLDEVSFELPEAGVATQVDSTGTRCQATTNYGDGQFGTPGAKNATCPGAPTSVTGDACNSAEQCESLGEQSVCLPDGVPFEGGYCTASCEVDADCGADARCLLDFYSFTTLCMASCEDATDCRDGYPCIEWDLSPDTADDRVCFPCILDAECPGNDVCSETGACVPPTP